jgi:hypothetical protein
MKNAIDRGVRAPDGQNSWNRKLAAITGTSPGAPGTAVVQQHQRRFLAAWASSSSAWEAYMSASSLASLTQTVRSPMKRTFLHSFVDQFAALGRGLLIRSRRRREGRASRRGGRIELLVGLGASDGPDWSQILDYPIDTAMPHPGFAGTQGGLQAGWDNA